MIMSKVRRFYVFIYMYNFAVGNARSIQVAAEWCMIHVANEETDSIAPKRYWKHDFRMRPTRLRVGSVF